MLNRNKILCSAMALSMVMSVVSPQLAYAYETNDSGYNEVKGDQSHHAKDKNERTWYYTNLKNGTIEIKGTEDLDSYLEVPETLDGKTVTVIKYVALAGERYDSDYSKNQNIVKKIKLPKTVKIIDDDAFDDCKSLTDIEMPEDIQMSDKVFDSCPNVRVNGHPNGSSNNSSSPVSASNLNLGWNTVGNDKYYVNSNRKLQTGWMDLNGKRYYFYSTGQMATAFINLGDGAFYYLDPTPGNNVGNLVTGWKLIDNHWYYFNLTGQGKKERGYMQTGWFYNNGSWYYFYSDGKMATGFINLGGDAYYYLDESNSGNIGTLKTGWQKINDSWYYFNRSTSEGYLGMMRKGWQRIDGVWYYFYFGDGKMAHDTWIDGYYVNSSGAWS
jgi:glucan-binding YG repeat protein